MRDRTLSPFQKRAQRIQILKRCAILVISVSFFLPFYWLMNFDILKQSEKLHGALNSGLNRLKRSAVKGTFFYHDRLAKSLQPN